MTPFNMVSSAKLQEGKTQKMTPLLSTPKLQEGKTPKCVCVCVSLCVCIYVSSEG